MQNFGTENFDDSTCIRQNSSDFSTVKVLRYTVVITFIPWYGEIIYHKYLNDQMIKGSHGDPN